MKHSLIAVALVAVVGAVLFGATRGGAETTAVQPQAHDHAAAVVGAARATELRVTLSRLLGEHVLLATAATQRGLQGGEEFPALARELDRNSVELANAIGSVYGRRTRDEFLNGKLMWRDHIRFFVAYTAALAREDTAGRQRAMGNLQGYTEAFSAFLSRATGLPRPALQEGVTEHVGHLKGQLDAYAAGDYARSYRLGREAYVHMFRIGDALAAAIAEKFPQRFG